MSNWIVEYHPTKPNLKLIGYSMYARGGPEKIYFDTENDELVYEKYEPSDLECKWSEVFWYTGISFKEFVADYETIN